MRTAKIALADATFSIDKPYSYRIPAEWPAGLLPGMRVLVPFGRGNRHSEGIVLSVSDEEEDARLKTILTQLDDAPVINEQDLRLALWMRGRYFCTVYTAVRAMLPTGLWYALKDRYSIAPGMDRERAFAAAGKGDLEKRILELIFAQNGRAELEQIQKAFGVKNPRPALKQLTDRGVLCLETGARRQVRDKTEKLAVLRMPPQEAMELVRKRRSSAPMRYAVTELLCGIGSASVKEICYFTGASMQTVKSLERSGVLSLEEQEVFRRVLPDQYEPAEPVSFNREQQEAFDGLEPLCRSGRPEAALLYGVTGSGKTQIYIRLIRSVLDSGRTAIVLVPEIALTPNLLQLFISHFGEQVAVLHSSLRAGERYDEWKRIKEGLAKVVVGTRSAVFAPLQKIGLIVLDEEQEGTYKSESLLRYHARDVAKYRCYQNHALLLLGSATPAVETMYAARNGTYHLFTLHQRYNEQALPRVSIVDLKEELRAGNGTGLSLPLRRELEKNFERGEQSILFLNRRGSSRMVTCGECGEVPLCPRCSVHLTYHSANGRLMCHYCGHSEPLPHACPNCGGTLHFIGFGTQKIEEELHDLYPDIEVLRMDADTITAAQSHEVLLDRFQRKKIPILLGTQMVAKGLDFENVTLVGVIAADLSLYVNSYRASERTFSLLTQVVGRAGRGDKEGRAVIQSYTPENEVITLAACQDYDKFYEREIELRRLCRFPPFVDLFVLTVSGPEETAVLRACMDLRKTLDAWLGDAEESMPAPQVFGPAPAGIVKINNRYRYHITLNCIHTKEIRSKLAQLVRLAQEDKRNRGLSVMVDWNPLD